MTTNFDSVQTLKSSENCDKYSKSVSYETLVIGATTIGREIKQKESSLILRKAKFQAIFKFVLSSASGGAGGGKYNRISAFVSMPVLLIRSSLEKFFKKNFRDDSFLFLASQKDSFHRHSEPKAKNPVLNVVHDGSFTSFRMTVKRVLRLRMTIK